MKRVFPLVFFVCSMLLLGCTGQTTTQTNAGLADAASDATDTPSGDDASDARDGGPVDDASDAADATADGDASPGEDADAASDGSPDARDAADADTEEPSPLGGAASVSSDGYPPTGDVTTGDWWVHGDHGSDQNTGTTRAEPFATLGRALSAVSDGERIIVEGTLTPSTRVTLSGDHDSGIEIFNYGDQRWTLDFSGLADTKAVHITGSGYHLKGVEILNVPADRAVDVTGHHCTLEDFHIHHVNAGITGTGIQSYGGSFNIYQDGLIYHLGDGSTLGTDTGDCMALTGSGASLSEYSHDNYVVRVMCINGPDDGFDIYRGYDNYIIDSVAKEAGWYWTGNQGSSGGDGFGFKMGGADGSGRNHFIGCVAVDSRADGWHHNTATEPSTIRFSTAIGNGRWGFDVSGEGGAGHSVEDCIAYDNDDGHFYANTSQMINNSWDLGITDPQFHDAARGDFSLAQNSPARNAAQNGDHLGASQAALELLLKYWDVE